VKQVITEADVLEALRAVEDPEAPINIVDLGIVQAIQISQHDLAVELVPTYRSCPAKSFIARLARNRLKEAFPEASVRVDWTRGGSWDPGRISEEGRRVLQAFGIAVAQSVHDVACPHCGSRTVEIESRFGCAVCKSLYHCPSCRNAFEVMRGSLVMPAARSRATAKRIAS
jgi:ring-1,2-phenylacetyl-CoA epoxidase subunit PaaD